MELTVIIQEHPDGYVVRSQENFFEKIKSGEIKTGPRMNPEQATEHMKKAIDEQKKNPDSNKAKIPEDWKVPVKRFSGFVDGLNCHISADGNTREEVIEGLKGQIPEFERKMKEEARKNWIDNKVYLAEIEV